MDDPDPTNMGIEPDALTQMSSGNAKDMLDVLVVQNVDGWQVTDALQSRLRHFVELAVTASGKIFEAPHELTIVLSSDDEVRRLNKIYRGKDKATNVLSFPFEGSVPVLSGDAIPLGDIVFAHETLEREARDLGIEAEHHLYHLTIHGVLHLLGFDHDSEGAAGRMEALETKILLAEGCHDPYGASGDVTVDREGRETC